MRCCPQPVDKRTSAAALLDKELGPTPCQASQRMTWKKEKPHPPQVTPREKLWQHARSIFLLHVSNMAQLLKGKDLHYIHLCFPSLDQSTSKICSFLDKQILKKYMYIYIYTQKSDLFHCDQTGKDQASWTNLCPSLVLFFPPLQAVSCLWLFRQLQLVNNLLPQNFLHSETMQPATILARLPSAEREISLLGTTNINTHIRRSHQLPDLHRQ